MAEIDREMLLGLAERQVYRDIFNCVYSSSEKIHSEQLIKRTGLSSDATFKRARELSDAGVIMMYREGCESYVFSKMSGETAKVARAFEKMVRRIEKKKSGA